MIIILGCISSRSGSRAGVHGNGDSGSTKILPTSCWVRNDHRLTHNYLFYRIGRLCNETIEINGVTIPAGVTVYGTVREIQRDPRYWHNPEKFIPERCVI